MNIITAKAHTVIGLMVGFVLLFAPNIFGFTDNTNASMAAVWVGIFIILSELITTSPYSLLKLVPMRVHVVIDVLTGIFLVASPWLFDFMDDAHKNQWVPHVIFGLMIVGYALVTTTRNTRVTALER